MKYRIAISVLVIAVMGGLYMLIGSKGETVNAPIETPPSFEIK